MSGHTPQALAALMIPELDHAVPMAAGQQRSIRTKDYRPDFIVLVPNFEAATRLQVPQSDRPIITAGRQKLTCWMKAQPEPPRMTSQNVHALPPPDIPYLYQPLVPSANHPCPF